ncbi:MAG: PQQ-binding-like beta-propeller repeat protein [Acidobacteriota bacterium]|nr:PQQ-binding-like beta-propeller repeat protein [Acidobacteriota bacterium]
MISNRCMKLFGTGLSVLLAAQVASAGDWPAWRGKDGDSVWKEVGILERFPEDGLEIRWRTPVKEGYSGPVVADGRVFVADFERNQGTGRIDGTERMLALDEKTGELLWTHSWPVDYSSIMGSYAEGPRAVATVDGDRVYVVGAAGHLIAMRTTDGKELWRKHYPTDYDVGVPIFGFSSSVLIDGELAITIVGAEPDGMVIAYDKRTGEERWRAIETRSEPGYAQPTIVEAMGHRQLLIWHPLAIASLVPQTGEILWSFDYEARDTLSVADPTVSEGRLFLSQFYGGSLMLELTHEPGVKELWRAKGRTEMPKDTLALHSLITTPIFEGITVYGIGSYGELRALDARSGERIWEDKTMVRQGRWGSAFMVQNGDRWIAFSDTGDLIFCRFTRKGYEEIDRTHLIDPTTSAGFGPRRFGDAQINWGHPAFANRHVIVRNDREIVSASLAAN